MEFSGIFKWFLSRPLKQKKSQTSHVNPNLKARKRYQLTSKSFLLSVSSTSDLQTSQQTFSLNPSQNILFPVLPRKTFFLLENIQSFKSHQQSRNSRQRKSLKQPDTCCETHSPRARFASTSIHHLLHRVLSEPRWSKRELCDLILQNKSIINYRWSRNAGHSTNNKERKADENGKQHHGFKLDSDLCDEKWRGTSHPGSISYVIFFFCLLSLKWNMSTLISFCDGFRRKKNLFSLSFAVTHN